MDNIEFKITLGKQHIINFFHQWFSVIGIIGNCIAAVISYSLNKSIIWGIIHGYLSWLYVIYAYIRFDI